jgi:hypothetical protein
MKVDPVVTFWLGVVTTITLAVGQGTIHLTGIVPPGWESYITGWAAIVSLVNSTILTALAGVSSSKSGPLAGGQS